MDIIERQYTVKEAAEVLRVSPQTVRLYIKNGKLRATKGGQYRISESALAAFINQK